MALSALASGADLVAAAMVVIAVLGFLFTLARAGHQNTKESMDVLIRQRDEARLDLSRCESQVRALERALENLRNGV